MWSLDSLAGFSMRRAYDFLVMSTNGVECRMNDILKGLSIIWKSWVPSKVIAFSRLLLHYRLTTRLNLMRWGII